jgi:dihydrodipicolinate synthase/N-acetylneuraminate lyase
MNSQQLVSDPIGCCPAATVACFDPTSGDLPRRRLDPARTVQLLERLADRGAAGLLIAASTGHGHIRTTAELEEWLRCAAEASVGNAVRMALLRPEDGSAANQRLVQLLAELHYPVVFVRPGTDLPRGAHADLVLANLQPLIASAAAAGLAVGVYSIPDVSGVPLRADVAARLVASPGGDRIVACKITEPDYTASTLDYLRHPALRHLKIVQGWDPHLARALQDGPRHDANARQRCGVTSGPMSLCIDQYQHILAAARQQQWEEVAAAQQAVTILFESMQDDPARFADLQRAKYIMGLGHPLTGTVRREQVQRVLDALRSIPRQEDRRRLAQSLDLMQDGPYHDELLRLAG